MALPERKALEIRFPVVEGYVASLRRHRIACDLDSVERTSLNPWSTPTAVFVRPQVGYQVGHPGAFEGFGFEEADRQQYYDSVHPQTIEFAIAGEITRELTQGVRQRAFRMREPPDPVPPGAPHRAGLHPGARGPERPASLRRGIIAPGKAW